MTLAITPGEAGAGAPPRKPRRWLFAGWVGLLAIITVVALLVFVFPTQRFWQQRDDIGQAQRELEMLRDANTNLEARSAALNQDTEIERVARERYNLVKPGEKAYAVLPAPPAQALPAGWPYNLVAGFVALAPR